MKTAQASPAGRVNLDTAKVVKQKNDLQVLAAVEGRARLLYTVMQSYKRSDIGDDGTYAHVHAQVHTHVHTHVHAHVHTTDVVAHAYPCTMAASTSH